MKYFEITSDSIVHLLAINRQIVILCRLIIKYISSLNYFPSEKLDLINTEMETSHDVRYFLPEFNELRTEINRLFREKDREELQVIYGKLLTKSTTIKRTLKNG